MFGRNKPIDMFELFELSLIIKDVLWISLQDDIIEWTKIYFIGWKTMSYSSQKNDQHLGK